MLAIPVRLVMTPFYALYSHSCRLWSFAFLIIWTTKADLHQNLFPQAKSTYHPLKFLCLCWSMPLLQDQAISPPPTVTAACAYIIYCHLEISMMQKHRPILPNHTKCLSISIHHSQTLQTKQNDPLENELYEQHQSQTLCLLLLDKCIIAGSKRWEAKHMDTPRALFHFLKYEGSNLLWSVRNKREE